MNIIMPQLTPHKFSPGGFGLHGIFLLSPTPGFEGKSALKTPFAVAHASLSPCTGLCTDCGTSPRSNPGREDLHPGARNTTTVIRHQSLTLLLAPRNIRVAMSSPSILTVSSLTVSWIIFAQLPLSYAPDEVEMNPILIPWASQQADSQLSLDASRREVMLAFTRVVLVFLGRFYGPDITYYARQTLALFSVRHFSWMRMDESHGRPPRICDGALPILTYGIIWNIFIPLQRTIPVPASGRATEFSQK
ncbi:hypothetical protein EDB84DRAFT_1673839 [Lactarius hengduanensis]|nr:hypothetical protein EDB84DRAFT_1673839 [Lactarius hengduanensis]